MADSRIFVYAHGIRPTKRPETGRLTVKFSVEVAAEPINPDPEAKTRMKFHQNTTRDFPLPLDADDSLRRSLISTQIAALDITREKTTLWAWAIFPTSETFKSLDEIVSHLCYAAPGCADKGCMLVQITKVDRVSCEDYHKLCRKRVGGGPISGWIKENANDLTLNLEWCSRCLDDLHLNTPVDNKCSGLRAVLVEEEHQECSICLKELEKGSQQIRMPCSHLFHGFCIIEWIGINSSCPNCRDELQKDFMSLSIT